MSDCNCADFPFSPHKPCYDVCTGRILNYASPDELRSIFHIPEDIMDTIIGLKLENRVETLEEYANELDPGQSLTLRSIFSSLSNNAEAIKWLKENMKTTVNSFA